MKKNNKGFTLVEIIAVVTILGILLLVSVPKILDLVTDSRDEMYVQDAKKLIAQAQYVLSSNSDEVEKPIVGDYIVLSLNYLGTEAFSSPPNGGEYLTESSFVVVKNVQTDENAEFENYKYSVVLVEASEDGFYRGIKFRTEEELSDEGAKTLVDYFDSSELVYVDEDAAGRAGCDDLDRCLVNNQYVDANSHDSDMKPADASGDNFTGRYNIFITQTVIDDNTTFSAPEFNARVLSTDPSMQKMAGSVRVSATDDSPLNELKVCINISKKSSNDFPGIDDNSMCYLYGDSQNFSYDFDLSNYGFSYDSSDKAYFYIVVVDPERNYSRKRIVYEIHKNLAPEISSFVVRRHSDNDGVNLNLNFAKLAVDVTDDMDELDKLSVCIADSSRLGEEICNNYVPFNSIFGNSNYKYYFKNNKGIQINSLDGSEHYLTLFVKDSSGLVSQKRAKYDIDGVDENGPYIIYKNKAPTLDFELNAPPMISHDGYSSGQSLTNVKISIDVSDDTTRTENIKLLIGDSKETVTVAEFNASLSRLQTYNFSGKYDGKPRSLTIVAIDEFGEKTSVTKSLNNVYKNEKPKVKLNVTSSDSFVTKRNVLKSILPTGCVKGDEPICYELKSFSCNDIKKCKGSLEENRVINGSYTAHIEANITDDLDSISDIRACLTEKEGGCTSDSEFVPASTFSSYSYTFDSNVDAPYVSKAKERTLHFVVKDSYGETTESSFNYSFYENVAPKFISVGKDNITSTRNINIASVKVKNNFVIDDDFNDYEVEFCYLVKEKDYSGDIPDASEFKNCTRVIQNNTIDFEFLGNDGQSLDYDGQKIYTMYRAEDGYGEKTSIFGEVYNMSSNIAPEILEFVPESTAKIRDENNKEVTLYNSIIFDIKFKVSDPQDTYTFCLTTLSDSAKGYCDASTYEGRSHFRGDPLNDNKPYSGDDESVHVISSYNASRLNWNRTSKENEQWKYSFDVDSSFRTIDKDTHATTLLPTLLFVVMDSSGDTDSFEYRYIPRNSCSIHNEEYQKILKKEEQEKFGVAEGEEKITEEEINMEIITEGEYNAVTKEEGKEAFPGEDQTSFADNISPDSCSGLCYTNVYNNDINYVSAAFKEKNDVQAYFKKQLTYKDKLVQAEITKFGLVANDDCSAEAYTKLGCNYASCFDTGEVNYNVISLHLYEKDTTWTAKVSDIVSERKKYNSYCKNPEMQNELLFSNTDYRLRQGIDSYCGLENIKPWCDRRLINVKDYSEDLPTELLTCDHIVKEELPPVCSEVQENDYCDRESIFTKYLDVETYNKYINNEPDAPSKEEFDLMVSNAKNFCKKNVEETTKTCDESDKMNQDDYEKRLDECEKNNASMNTIIIENNQKRDAYQRKYNECTNEYQNSCKKELNSYEKVSASEGKIEVSCDSSGSFNRVYCDENFMDGKCLTTNASCELNEECPEGEECDVDPNKLICRSFCYKDFNCNEKDKVQIEAVCHGYFKLYRSTVNGKKVILEDTGMRLCPELFSSKAYGNRYIYNDKDKYVKFFPRDYGGIINE